MLTWVYLALSLFVAVWFIVLGWSLERARPAMLLGALIVAVSLIIVDGWGLPAGLPLLRRLRPGGRLVALTGLAMLMAVALVALALAAPVAPTAASVQPPAAMPLIEAQVVATNTPTSVATSATAKPSQSTIASGLTNRTEPITAAPPAALRAAPATSIPAPPTPTPSAKERLDRAWAERNWPDAIAAIQELRSTEPQPDEYLETLYGAHINHAQSLRERGSRIEVLKHARIANSLDEKRGADLALLRELVPGPGPDGSVAVSGGLGLDLAEWERHHTRNLRQPLSFALGYDSGDFEVSAEPPFGVWRILRLYAGTPDDPFPSLAAARAEAALYMPRDAILQQTQRTPVSAPSKKAPYDLTDRWVDQYTSPFLSRQWAASRRTVPDPGRFLVVYQPRTKDERIVVMLIALATNPSHANPFDYGLPLP